MLGPTIWAKEAPSLPMEIQGIHGDELKNVQNRLKLIQLSTYGNVINAGNVSAFAEQAPEEIKSALQPYGYFAPIITTHISYVNGAPSAIHFIVHPGPTLHIQRVIVTLSGEGIDNLALQRYIQNFPLQRGQVLLTDAYEKVKKDFLQLANNQGFIKAQYTQKEIRVDLKNYSAIIRLTLDTGPRYYFGKMTFSKNPYAPSFLDRFITLHEGEPFSSAKLLTMQQDLNSSGYFQQALIDPQFAATRDYKIPSLITITVPKSQQYNIGLGYGTYTGPRIMLGVDFNRVTDTGQRFSLQLKYSPVIKGLAAKYYIPGSNPVTDKYSLGANIQQSNTKVGSSFAETLFAGYDKKMGGIQHSIYLNLLNEHYTVDDEPYRTSHFLYPSYTLSRTRTDDPVNPTSGSKINLTVQSAYEKIFATTSFAQAELYAKYIFSPLTDTKFITRGDLGYTVVHDFSQLPLSLSYSAGGLNSIRGYAYDSIGPGRYLEIASMELQRRVIGNWYGAIFYDVGTATNHFNQSFNRGDGVGVIYQSVIGPIKLYVARAESKSGKPMSIEFSLGPEF